MRLFWHKPTRGPKPDIEAERQRLDEIKAQRPAAVAIAFALWNERQHNHFSESLATLYRGGTAR